MNTNTTNMTNTSSMIKIARDVVLVSIGHIAYNKLGNILQNYTSDDVVNATLAPIIDEAIKQLLPSSEVDCYTGQDIYEYAVLACHQALYPNETSEEYDSWMEDALDAMRSIGIACKYDYETDLIDLDAPMLIYRTSLPQLFASYLASKARPADQPFQNMNGERLLPFEAGNYKNAVAYIDEVLCKYFQDDTILSDLEYQDIWKEAAKCYTDKHVMTIAEQVRANQDTKEMTRRAIKILITAGEDVSDLIAEFKATYGEEV